MDVLEQNVYKTEKRATKFAHLILKPNLSEGFSYLHPLLYSPLFIYFFSQILLRGSEVCLCVCVYICTYVFGYEWGGGGKAY